LYVILILNNSCEFYYDDVTVTSFVNDKYGDATADRIFSGQKDVTQIPFTLRCVQYMVTSVLQDQQYMFGVRSLLVVSYGRESVVDEKRPGRCVVSTTDPAISAVASLIRSDQRVSRSVEINLDSMLKNKRLMFDI